MPMTGGEKPWKLTKSNSDERDAAFSPDGKWLAYSSDRSGRRDVWIQPFPAPPGGADRWMVSVEGGSRPMWSRATKELFYLAPDNRIMAVPVGLDRGFHAGVPKALFQVNVVDDYRVHFALTADGSRFLIPVADAAASPSRTVVVNWLAGIKP